MLIWPIAVLVTAGIILMILERILPARSLPHVPGWWMRVILINIMQAGVVVLGGLTWEQYLQSLSLVNVPWPNEVFAVATTYFAITFVFYWWHKWRHDVEWLWTTCHQIHHSPSRIETITSFYKHPLEIFLNSIIIATIAYPVMGLSLQAGAWVTVCTGLAEFLYHMNIKTPYWWGFVFQRPESHRVHHERNKHYKNFADLPLWDMIFGTFENPHREVTCGFRLERELMFYKMLTFKNVNQKRDLDE